MESTLYCNDCFTFHASWLKAMRYIKSPSVRNRLIAAIVEYGLNRVYTPIGNSVADAIFCLIIDRIDRESPRIEGKSVDTAPTPDLQDSAPAEMGDQSRNDDNNIYDGVNDEDISNDGDSLSRESESESPQCIIQESDAPADDYSAGVDNMPAKKDNGCIVRRKSKSRKKKRRARNRKHRR